MNVEKLVWSIFIGFCIFAIGIFVWDNMIQEYVQLRYAYEEFCEERGLGEVTDFNGLKVECNETVYVMDGMSQRCIEKNKWGVCKEEHPYFYMRY